MPGGIAIKTRPRITKMRSRKLVLPLLALSVTFLIAFGTTQAFTCAGDECRLSANEARYFKAAPEYSSGWKDKMRLIGRAARPY